MGLVCLFYTPGVLDASGQQPDAQGVDTVPTPGIRPRTLTAEETLISPNDLLFIQVFDVEQMTREYRVSGAGTVDFPLLADPVPVSGLAPRQAATAISQKCIEVGVLSHPQISVTIRESRLHSVSVAGAVKNPQVYPVFGRISLVDLLTQAGGVADDAGATVTITQGEVSRRLTASRAGGPGETTDPPSGPAAVTIDLPRLLEKGDPSSNIDIYPGDHVAVQRAGVVYVMGAVNKAGGYLLSEARQNMTVLKALALAGYLSPFAKGKKALLLRPDPSASKGRDEIPINLTAMLKGAVSDRPLQNNDILFVPDSAAAKVLHRSADAAQMAAGLSIVYH